MLLREAIEDYIRHIEVEKGYSRATIVNYQNRLRYLNNWVAQNGYAEPTLSDLTTPLLRRFLLVLVTKKQRPRTVKGKFAAIADLCKFAIAEGHITDNPTDKITLPKLDAAKRLLINDEQITMLFAACDKVKIPRRQTLSRAVLSILAYAGLRRAECRDLLLGDINLNDKCILIRSGKGAKSRRVFLPDVAVSHLREWVAQRGHCNHDYLFGSVARRMHDDGLANLIKDLKLLSGQPENDAIQPHSIRHAYATRRLRNGANIVDISASLGHSGSNALRTTQVYLSTNEEQLRSIAGLSELPDNTAPTPEPAPKTPVKNGHVRTIFRR